MPCYHPIEAWQFGTRIYFKNPGPLSRHLKLPCGRCIGCKLERSRQWAVRLMHEAQLHEKKCFITLTYNNKSLTNPGASSQSLTAPGTPRLGLPHQLDSSHTRETHAHEAKKGAASLSKRDLQLFTKALHMQVLRQEGSAKGIRYFAAGEYGEKTDRPHYHIAVYGEDFSGDRRKWRTAGKYQVWRSPRLEKLWPHGHSEIGELTFESAAYIARYVTKKITGEKAHEHYKRTDEHGNDYWLEPEFSVMSRRPGLGKGWFDKYQSSVYPHDRVIINGRAAKPPRFYDLANEKTDPEGHSQVKTERRRKATDQPVERLRAGEAITRAKLKQKPRPLE